MNQLALPQGVDKLSVPQKVFALGLLGVSGYFILPFVLALMVNVLMTIVVAIPIVFIAYNYQLVWSVFKEISWQSTRFFISLDVIRALGRYREWVAEKHQSIKDVKVTLMANQESINNDILQLETSYKNQMKKVDYLDVNNKDGKNDIQISTYLVNAKDDKDQIESFIPMRDDNQRKIEYLGELDELFQANLTQLDHKIKNLTTKYKNYKAMAKGIATANAVIGGANDATKQWDEAVLQTNNQINSFTANIKAFEQNLKPILEGAKFDRQIREGEGRKLLEEFRKTNRQLQS